MSKPRQSFSMGCTIVNNKLRIDRDEFAMLCERFVDGQCLVLTLEEEGRKRTAAQNRFFHGPILTTIAKAFRELGWTREDVKTELCLQFIPDEHTREDGSVVLVPGHTSALDVEPFNDFIDACIQFAAEHDIYIEDAQDWKKRHGVAA